MKISFPTNDRKTIAKRTGRCEEFAIYDIVDGEIKSVDYLKNTHEHHDHNHEHKQKKDHGERQHSHSDIMNLLKDIDLLIVGRVGKYMKKDIQTSGLKYQLTKKTSIVEAIQEYFE